MGGRSQNCHRLNLFVDLILEFYICNVCMCDSSGSTEHKGRAVMPEKIAVVCTGMEGIYYPSLHM